MAPPAQTITVALHKSNKHTYTNQKAATDQHARHNHEFHRKLKDAKPTQHTGTTHPDINLKLAFLNVAFSHPHYLTSTPLTFHTQSTGSGHCIRRLHHHHIYTQVRVQPRNTYNYTYIKVSPWQNITISR